MQLPVALVLKVIVAVPALSLDISAPEATATAVLLLDQLETGEASERRVTNPTDKDPTVSTYAFDLQQSVYNRSLIIDAKNITEANGPISTRFKPSGASINPATDELYILSSVNKLLVVANRNGKIKETYHLDPSIFNQPEGITFTANGSLFISNEADETHAATILFYQFKKMDNK